MVALCGMPCGEADTGAIGIEEVEVEDATLDIFVRGIFVGGRLLCPSGDPPPPLIPFIPVYPGGALGPGTMGSSISCLTRSASARFIIRKIEF